MIRHPQACCRRALPAACFVACLLIGLVAGLTGGPRSALAAPSRVAQKDAELKEAKKLEAQGKRLFSLYRFAEALERFEDAFALHPSPNILFNIAQCHRNLKNYEQAIFSFRRFLKLTPTTDRRAQIEELIAELEELERARVQERKRQDLVPTATNTREAPPKSAPVYKRWWFWTGFAAVAAGTTAAVLLTRDSANGLPDTDLGNLDFGL